MLLLTPSLWAKDKTPHGLTGYVRNYAALVATSHQVPPAGVDGYWNPAAKPGVLDKFLDPQMLVDEVWFPLRDSTAVKPPDVLGLSPR